MAAMVVFSLAASGIYVLNDLLDIEFDRKNAMKRLRPLASGAVSKRSGAAMIPILLGSSLSLSVLLEPSSFTAVTAVYMLSAALYSFSLKRVPILDVVILSLLYTLRVVAGGVATGIRISPWLLAFSMFLFLSIAFLKRYAEVAVRASPVEVIGGRGYLIGDESLMAACGISAGYLSVLVFALYISNSGDVPLLYSTPLPLWGICPLLLYWISRLWLFAFRGMVKADPIMFILTDKTSYVVAALVACLMLVATYSAFLPVR